MLLGILFILAYLLGSIPTAIWISKRFYGVDIRNEGSGNAGSTNMFRVLGVKAGIVVQMIDIFKGMLAVGIFVWLLKTGHLEVTQALLLEVLIAVTAVLGHIFPIFAQFRGGKGINTLLGAMLVVHWQVALLCIGVFLLMLLISNYVSLSSMVAVLSFPIWLQAFNWFFDKDYSSWFIISGFLMFVLVVYTHRSNIKRLWKHQENKVQWKKLRKA